MVHLIFNESDLSSLGRRLSRLSIWEAYDRRYVDSMSLKELRSDMCSLGVLSRFSIWEAYDRRKTPL